MVRHSEKKYTLQNFEPKPMCVCNLFEKWNDESEQTILKPFFQRLFVGGGWKKWCSWALGHWGILDRAGTRGKMLLQVTFSPQSKPKYSALELRRWMFQRPFYFPHCFLVASSLGHIFNNGNDSFLLRCDKYQRLAVLAEYTRRTISINLFKLSTQFKSLVQKNKNQ